ncbi:Aspergillopepsin-2 [Penicillium cinerascens]|uniref:Aspergillopepsin-2 n=1 Tax=Penicillium cinerascens TaxID=70096 RepID=A0A9W9N1S8_9EURO|nr:Aspergillopepsin-2 [Penicillium cinerascens]KAJ5211582.1 Aspergillopepsin-2 [Penicillium cinerascens]
MKFSTSILSSSLLAATAIAAPLTAQRQARNAARQNARAGKTQLPMKPGTNEVMHFKQTTEEQYDSNWAGAVLIGSGYTAVTASIVVPTPQAPSDASPGQQYCAAAWVGIDGDTCSSAILQTGVDFCIQDGSTTYSAWYEWFPDNAYNFNNLEISAGDTIQMTVDASSLTSGTATIENTSTGQSVTHTFNGGEDGSLCETNAEWIVEDFEEGGSLVPFANFGAVTFSGAEAMDGGSTVGTDGATIVDIQSSSGQVLTSSSASGNSVTVQYVGQ